MGLGCRVPEAPMKTAAGVFLWFAATALATALLYVRIYGA